MSVIQHRVSLSCLCLIAMSQRPSPTPDLKQPVVQAARHPWFEKLARWGIVARGVVYFVVGLLAVQAAIGVGGKTTDTQGALTEIVTQPFGKILLGIVAIGLIGYAVWQIVQTILDPERRGQDRKKRIMPRIGFAASGVVYAGLATTAIKLILLGSNSAGNGHATQGWTAKFLAEPFGQWLVGLAGAITIGVGFAFLYQAYKAKFRRNFNLEQMSQTERKWAIGLGQFGTAARGIVLAIIGFFLIQAAIHANANEAKGFGDALATLAQPPFGSWLLGIVAVGLIAYSIYSFIEARYRHIVRPQNR